MDARNLREEVVPTERVNNPTGAPERAPTSTELDTTVEKPAPLITEDGRVAKIVEWERAYRAAYALLLHASRYQGQLKRKVSELEYECDKRSKMQALAIEGQDNIRRQLHEALDARARLAEEAKEARRKVQAAEWRIKELEAEVETMTDKADEMHGAAMAAEARWQEAENEVASLAKRIRELEDAHRGCALIVQANREALQASERREDSLMAENARLRELVGEDHG